MRLLFSVLILFGSVCHATMAADLPKNLRDNIDKSFAEYTEACQALDEKYLLAFDKQIEIVRKTPRIQPTEKQAFIAIIEAEKTVYQKNGSLAFSAPMREATSSHLTQLERLRISAMKPYDKAIEHAQTKLKDDVVAAELVAEKAKVFEPKVIGTWDIVGLKSVYGFKLELLSDSTTNRENGTWSMSKQGLVHRFPNAVAPGGQWINTCVLEDSGKTFLGTDQSGGTQRGTRVDPQ